MTTKIELTDAEKEAVKVRHANQTGYTLSLTDLLDMELKRKIALTEMEPAGLKP